jgi:hypothetical protein
MSADALNGDATPLCRQVSRYGWPPPRGAVLDASRRRGHPAPRSHLCSSTVQSGPRVHFSGSAPGTPTCSPSTQLIGILHASNAERAQHLCNGMTTLVLRCSQFRLGVTAHSPTSTTAISIRCRATTKPRHRDPAADGARRMRQVGARTGRAVRYYPRDMQILNERGDARLRDVGGDQW